MKIVDIEANTAVDIASTMILPAVARYLGELAAAPSSKGINSICVKVTGLADSLVDSIEALQHAQHEAHEAGTLQSEAKAFAIGGHPRPGRSADGGRRTRDARGRRPLATAEVSRAALPVLSP